MELGFGLTKIIPYFVYGTFLLVAVLTIMYRIEVGIFFLVPLIPQQSMLDSVSSFFLGEDIVDVLLVAMLIKWASNSSKRTEGFLMKTPVNLPIFCLMFWTFFELWMGSFNLGLPLPISIRDARFVVWKNFMILPLLYLIVVNNIKDKRHVKILILLMALSMLFMDRHFYNNFSSHSTDHYRDDLRTAGTFTYLGPNELAAFYAQYTLIIFCIALIDRVRWIRLGCAVVTVFNYYCMIFLFSRGGYLATLVGWSFLGLVKDRKVLAVIIVLIIFWRSILPTAVIERIEMTQTEKGADTSVQERIQMWNQAMAVFKSNPLMGIGYNTTPHFGFSDSITKQHRNNLHNGYVEVLAELGLIGLVIYLAIFFKGIAAGWRLYKLAEDKFFKAIGLGFAASIVASLTANLTGNNWHYFNVAGFFWVMFGLVVQSAMILEKEKAEDSDSPANDIPEKAKPLFEPSYV